MAALTITAADLDTAEGLDKFDAMCGAMGACLPSRTFFARERKKRTPLRTAIRTMVKASVTMPEHDPRDWPAWAYENVPCDDQVAGLLLDLMETVHGENFRAFAEANVKRAS